MNLLTKININISFLILLLLGMITGLFKEIIIFTSIILIHELGHLTIGSLFNKKVEKINIYMFGGYIKFKSYVNSSFIEEFSIGMAGFLFQTIYYLTIILFFNLNIITSTYFLLFKQYYFAILIFNLIPIYPLDGHILVKLFLMKIFPFKIAHRLGIYISFIIAFIVLILSIIYNLSLNYFMILTLLIKELILEYKQRHLIFNKFLLERHLYKFNFKKRKVFKHNKVNKMYKGVKHTFKDRLGYKTEKQILNKKFDLK